MNKARRKFYLFAYMARWSSGQDAALSRRKQGFDSPTSCWLFKTAQPIENAVDTRFWYCSVFWFVKREYDTLAHAFLCFDRRRHTIIHIFLTIMRLLCGSIYSIIIVDTLLRGR